MNKIEAIRAMKQGHKVTHEWFTDEEYIYMIDDEIYDENDYKMSYIGANNQLITFWTDRTDSSWVEGGWSIYKTGADLLLESNPYTEKIHALKNYRSEIDYRPAYIVRFPNENYTSKNSHKRTNKRKKR